MNRNRLLRLLLFLLYKTVKEIHQKLEGEAEHEAGIASKPLGFSTAVFQIILIDMVFSFDSIITAGGTAKHIEIMIAAVVIAMIVMFLFSTHISSFIHKHPTLKMLALSFLVMIGLVLIVEGWDPKNAHEMHTKCKKSAESGHQPLHTIAHEWPHFLSYRPASGASKSAGATCTVLARSPPSDRQGIGQQLLRRR